MASRGLQRPARARSAWICCSPNPSPAPSRRHGAIACVRRLARSNNRPHPTSTSNRRSPACRRPLRRSRARRGHLRGRQRRAAVLVRFRWAHADQPAEAAVCSRGDSFPHCAWSRAQRAASPLDATSLLAPIPQSAKTAASLGHTNVALDRDGAARFEAPAVAYGDDFYPSFALEVARQHLGVVREDIRLELGRGVRLDDRLVPTDDRTQLVVNYRGAR